MYIYNPSSATRELGVQEHCVAVLGVGVLRNLGGPDVVLLPEDLGVQGVIDVELFLVVL